MAFQDGNLSVNLRNRPLRRGGYYKPANEQFHGGMATEDMSNAPIKTRLEQGRKAKAERGGYIGYGSPAYGERAVDGELVEDPDEQQVIELIRRHHKSGKSLQQIANWLNQNGYKTKRGRLWKRVSVKRVLDRLREK